MTALFLLLTLLPYVVAVRLASRRGENPPSTDRWRFEVMVLGTGGLYAILHIVVFAGVLSIPAAAAAGGAGVLVTWLGFRRLAAGGAGAVSGRQAGATPDARTTMWMERISTVAVAAVCGLWLFRSAAGLDIGGTDAAHYHLPHAVNYALGASPWGPMPTPHAYPMGTSLLFAWFILPFGDAFVVDASMIVWYLFLVTSLAALFHVLTGISGWTWTPWLALVLFGLPLIQVSAQPSADLPYAATFVAVAAQLAWMVSRRAFALRDWAVLGVSLGLLIGCKAPGAYSAALLAAAAGAGQLASRKRGARLRVRFWAAPLAVASAAGLLAGGIWLVRNTWLFGQPVAFYTDRYHLSIMQDVRTVYGGDWLYMLFRAGIKIGRVLAPHFLAAGAAIVWLCLESAVLVARRRSDAVDAVRLWFVGLMALVAGAHVAGLVGAPWTSLEWTEGRSLRYLLPIWILYALLAYVGLFSRFLPWYRSVVIRTAVWLLVAGAATWQAARFAGPAGLQPAGDLRPGLVVTTAVLLVLWAVVTSPAGRPLVPTRLVFTVARVVMVVVAAIAAAAWLDDRHTTLLAAANREESDTLKAWMASTRAAGEPHRQVYLDVRADESQRERACGRRRFFVASRFDFPLALQPATLTSQVFDSRRVDLVLPLLRRDPGAGVCDYEVVSRDETTRQAIRLSSAWLRPIETTGRLLIYEVRRSPGRSGRSTE